MHAEIELTQKHLFVLYERQRAYLAGKPISYVEDLLHRAEEGMKTGSFTVRTAAEINYTACFMVLGMAERKGGKL